MNFQILIWWIDFSDESCPEILFEGLFKIWQLLGVCDRSIPKKMNEFRSISKCLPKEYFHFTWKNGIFGRPFLNFIENFDVHNSKQSKGPFVNNVTTFSIWLNFAPKKKFVRYYKNAEPEDPIARNLDLDVEAWKAWIMESKAISFWP